jgi:hypothetical protein
MRPSTSVTLVLIALIACVAIPANAGQPYTASYSISASSPIDDSSTKAIEAQPGMPITITATASGTYDGKIPVPLPSFTVSLQYDLKRGNNVIDTKKDSYGINGMFVKPGKTYSQTASKSYTLPSDLQPGDYTLYCTAVASVLGISRTEHASFTIKIVTDARLKNIDKNDDKKEVKKENKKDTTVSQSNGDSCDMWHFPIFN